MIDMSKAETTTTTFRSDSLFDGPFRENLSFIMAYKPEQLLPVNIDASTVYRTSLTALRNIEPHLMDIAKMPFLDHALIQRLKGLALTLSHANALLNAAESSQNDLAKQAEEAATLRDTLQVDITSLIRHGVVNNVTFPTPTDIKAYRTIGEGLQARATFLRENWGKIVGKCGVQPEDIDHALELAALIQEAVGQKESGLFEQVSAVEIRQRAFTGCVLAYNELRRAMLYLRTYNGDADALVPSLYSVGRHAHRNVNSDENAPDEVVPANVAPVAATTPVDGKKVPSGGPGGNPFMD